MKKIKRTIPGSKIRNTWTINPVTRIHDNDLRKNKKKARQEIKKALKDFH